MFTIYRNVTFLTAFGSLLLGLIVLLRGRKNALNRRWFFFCLSVGAWNFGFAMTMLGNIDKETALLFSRLSHASGALIPALFINFIYIWLDLKTLSKRIIKICNIMCQVLFVASLTPVIVVDIVPKMMFPYYPVGEIGYFVYVVNFVWWVIFSHYFLINRYKKLRGYRRSQMQYLLVGTILGFLGGATCFPLIFGIKIVPYATVLVFIYIVTTTYAIIRYHLMDIRLVITRVSIFVFVYSLVLGVPFIIAFTFRNNLANFFGEYWWAVPMILMAVLATAGPSIYISLQKKAEERILQEEIRLKALLTEASFGMRTIHNLQKLSEFIVNISTKILQLDDAAVYIKDLKEGVFVKKASKIDNKDYIKIRTDDPLVKRLSKKKNSIVYEEIKMMIAANPEDLNLNEIINRMKELSANIVVPITEEKSLIGFIVMGKKEDKSLYSKDLVNVLFILGNQAALAIENCRFWEIERNRMQEESLRERIASMDHMASSFAHEVQNPVQGVTGHIFLINEEMQSSKDNLPKGFVEAVTSSLGFIKECVHRISSMVDSILEYSRLGTGELSRINIEEVILSFNHLMMPEIKQQKIHFEQKVEKDLPLIKGNKVQMEEILINLTQNSIHALQKIKDKRIKLKIFKKANNHIRIEFSDNGYGIPEEIIKDIFLASVTTKGSVEGTGLGLFRCRKIINNYGGEIWAESKGKGAKFIVEI